LAGKATRQRAPSAAERCNAVLGTQRRVERETCATDNCAGRLGTGAARDVLNHAQSVRKPQEQAMNRSTKSLSLRKETLVELNHVQLDGAVGGYIINNTAFKRNDTSFGTGSRVNDTVWRPHPSPSIPRWNDTVGHRTWFGCWPGHAPQQHPAPRPTVLTVGSPGSKIYY
jgi:hypothetical protein